MSYTARRLALSLKHPPPFFFRVLLLLTQLGGDVIFLTPMGGSGENNHPSKFKTPPHTNKTGPRIEQQGTGRVNIPPTPSRPLQGQTEPIQAQSRIGDAMAHTNRTASSAHRRWRARLITQARKQGQTECPLCGATITWDTHQLPTSPEADHITPVSRGGLNTLDNGQIICRTCNRSKGNRSEPNISFQQQTTKTLIPW